MGASHSPTKGRFDVPASSHFLNIYSYFILTSSVGSVFATSRGQEEMGRAQRHWEPPWGTPGRSGGQPASTPGVGAGVMAGWHPGVEQGDSRLAPWGRGRRGLRAQRRCENPAGGPCSRPSEGAPRLTGSGLRQAPSAQQPAGSATFAARTPAARSPRPGCRPAPSRTRRPQKRPPRCHRILALRPSPPPDRRLCEGGDSSCCALVPRGRPDT